MKTYRVHRVQFYKPEAHAIHCSSYNEDFFNLAISRSNNVIEVWDLRHAPFQKQVFPCYRGYSVEALAWCGNRLFSTGLSAYVLEYSFSSLLPKRCTSTVGGPAWCLAFNRDRSFCAVGTEDGFINLFRVTDDTIEFEKNFENQEGRILCLAWNKTGDCIASGSTDTIRLWNVATGRIVDRILVGRVHQHVETTVWCLAILGNDTIVSGDSCGRTCFWDMKTATLINEARDHKADVLTLCASKDEKSIFASGIDPVIIQYNQVWVKPSKSSETTWVKSFQNVLHSHDVRTLSVAGSYLVSGGIDTYLVLSKHSPRVTIKCPPFLQNGSVHLASQSRCLLLLHSKTLQLWKLGTSVVPEKQGDGDSVPLKDNIMKILELRARDSETIVCAAVSPDVRWLAYSTLDALRLFYLTLAPTATLQKVKRLPLECHSATRLCFTWGNKLVVTNGATISILGSDLTNSTLLHSFIPDSGSFISHLCCSSIAEYIAAANLEGMITIYNLENFTVLCTLPQHHCAATAVAFHPRSGNLFAVYSDHRIVEYDLSKKSYTRWTRNLMQSSTPFLNVLSPVLRITFDEDNAVILHDDNTVYSIRMDQSAPSVAKKSRQQQERNQDSDPERPIIQTSTRYKHLIAFLQLGKDEMVAVEVLPRTIKKQLPPALRQKKFGT